MSQQINLYQRATRTSGQALEVRTMGYVLIAAVGLMALASGYGGWRHWSLQRELGRLQEQEAALQQQLAELNRRHPVPVKSVQLEQEVQRLEADRGAKSRVLAALAGQRLAGNTAGFSRYLEGIAKRCPSGMWLTGISISEGGAHLTLSGSALRPELVPKFLQELAAEEVFAGREFKVFQMKRDPATPDRIDFLVRTELEGKAAP